MILTTDATGAPVYAYVINDTEIVDAYVSECGRFDVTPDYYGLTQAEAQKLRNANKMNTYKITAYLKITIEVEAPDDDKAWDDAEAAQLADWTQHGLEIVDCENLGVIQNDEN